MRTRVTIILYLIGFWIFILLTLLLEAIKLLIIVGIIYVLIRLLFSSGNEPNSYDPIGENRSGNRTIGVAGKGQRINPETGRVEEEGIFGWDNTKSRTNPDTGIVQEKDLLAGKIQEPVLIRKQEE